MEQCSACSHNRAPPQASNLLLQYCETAYTPSIAEEEQADLAGRDDFVLGFSKSGSLQAHAKKEAPNASLKAKERERSRNLQEWLEHGECQRVVPGRSR